MSGMSSSAFLRYSNSSWSNYKYKLSTSRMQMRLLDFFGEDPNSPDRSIPVLPGLILESFVFIYLNFIVIQSKLKNTTEKYKGQDMNCGAILT